MQNSKDINQASLLDTKNIFNIVAVRSKRRRERDSKRAEVCERMRWIDGMSDCHLTGGERNPGVMSRYVYQVISACQLRWTERYGDIQGNRSQYVPHAE